MISGNPVVASRTLKTNLSAVYLLNYILDSYKIGIESSLAEVAEPIRFLVTLTSFSRLQVDVNVKILLLFTPSPVRVKS